MAEIELQSSAGRLRARHDAPQGEPPRGGPRAAVVCHPHPAPRLIPGVPDMPGPGGTLDNKVVHSLAKGLAAHGLHVVRFDFRGAGGSEGEHDYGRGERDDVRAALDFAASLVGPDEPLLVAGFSFGAFVGLDVAVDDPRVGYLLAVAPPVNHYGFERVAACGKPLAVIYALEDELVPRAEVEGWIATCRAPPAVTPVPAAGHLFHGRLRPLREAAERAVEHWRGAS